MANRKFVFRIKTESGGTVGNIVIQAKDRAAAEVKLRKTKKVKEILNCEEKQVWLGRGHAIRPADHTGLTAAACGGLIWPGAPSSIRA